MATPPHKYACLIRTLIYFGFFSFALDMYHINSPTATIVFFIEIGTHSLFSYIADDLASIITHLHTGHFGSIVIKIIIADGAPLAHIDL